MRNFSILSAVTALALLSACADSRNVEGLTGGASGCVGCHGGLNGDTTGAPPFDVTGATSSVAVGAHRAHVARGVQCGSCHAHVALQMNFPGHQNGTSNVDFGSVAFDPNGLTTPTWSAATHSCSNVYCHAPSTALGGSNPTPDWTAPGSVTCGSCHAGPGVVHGGGLSVTQCNLCHASSVDPSGATMGTHSNGTVERYSHGGGAAWITPDPTHNGVTPHGLAATYQDKANYPTGFEGCKACHGSNLDNPVTTALVPTCDGCHGGTAWRTTCTFCHGDSARAAVKSAPPFDASGVATSSRVGAHLAHLQGISTNTPRISAGVACDDCHGGASRALPTDWVHANGSTEVTLKRPTTTTVTGTYDASTGTCSNTYCHGNLPRNAQLGNNPAWTATSGQSACDSCHKENGSLTNTAANKTGQHDRHTCGRSGCHSTSDTQTGCQGCHLGYQRQIGATPPVVNTANHVNGTVDIFGTATVNGRSITITWNPTAQTCTTSCHTIGAHGTSNPKTW